ncbi:MAG: hypothetical protein FWG04_01185 [Desulfovibrionaceae bacterium]|nr:hypothetical protein [Desulfovibrionaceae bacterium]
MYDNKMKRGRRPRVIAKAITVSKERVFFAVALASAFTALCISLALRGLV